MTSKNLVLYSFERIDFPCMKPMISSLSEVSPAHQLATNSERWMVLLMVEVEGCMMDLSVDAKSSMEGFMWTRQQVSEWRRLLNGVKQYSRHVKAKYEAFEAKAKVCGRVECEESRGLLPGASEGAAPCEASARWSAVTRRGINDTMTPFFFHLLAYNHRSSLISPCRVTFDRISRCRFL